MTLVLGLNNANTCAGACSAQAIVIHFKEQRLLNDTQVDGSITLRLSINAPSVVPTK